MTAEKYKPEYQNSWALVIGIDYYKDPQVPPLMTAVKGAQSFADLLRNKFGFPPDRVILLENEKATQAAIRRAFTDPFGRQDKVVNDDRVIVYFGGHGITYDTAEGEIGCVTTYDTEVAYWDTTIPMDELTRLANRSHAKHILFLLDACFSGYATTRSMEGGGRQADDYLTRAARQVISAGMRNQLVSDTLGPDGHSLFTGFLLEGLQGAAPMPGGVLRAFHMAGYLQDMVGQHSGSRQTPQYASLLGSQGGDFIFAVREVGEISTGILLSMESEDPAQRLTAVAQLRTITQDADADKAALALGKLEALTSDPDEMVRASARGALRALLPKTNIMPVVREKLLSIAATPQIDTVEMASPVSVPAPAPARHRAIIWINAGPARGTRFELDTDGGVIGRADGNWLSFPDDDRLSRKHARFDWQGDELWLSDLGSTNGTYVNKQPLTEPYHVQAGDNVMVGKTEFSVVFPKDEDDTPIIEKTKEISGNDLQEMAARMTQHVDMTALIASPIPITASNVAQMHAVRVLSDQLEGVTSVSWSPDSLRLAAGFTNNSVMVWDDQGNLLRTMLGHTLDVVDVVWSQDGVRLASASRDSTISVWDTSSGRRLRTFKGKKGYLTSVDWSLDGALIAVGSRDGTILVWDAATGEQRYNLAAHTNVANDVAWSPDGIWLASCASDKTALIWESALGEWRHVLEGHTDDVRCLAWSPDARYLATGSCDKTIIIWEVATGKVVRKIEGHLTDIVNLAWSPHGDVLVSASQDGMLILWNPDTGSKLRTLSGIHYKTVQGLDWSPDATRLATGSLDRKIAIWEIAKA